MCVRERVRERERDRERQRHRQTETERDDFYFLRNKWQSVLHWCVMISNPLVHDLGDIV